MISTKVIANLNESISDKSNIIPASIIKPIIHWIKKAPIKINKLNEVRALTSFNLLIFIGAFFIQWIIGLIIDAGIIFDLSEIDSFKLAMTFVLITSLFSYIFFLRKNLKVN